MSQTSSAYSTLRKAILECELAPGSSLAISGLKARFGFGWTPLREALPRLESEHLVRFEANKGYRVATVSLEGLRDLQVAREAVETTLLARAMTRGGDEWEATLIAAHHLLEQVSPNTPGAPTPESLVWEERHDAFHRALTRGADAPWLGHLAQQTADQQRRHHFFMLHSQDVIERLEETDGPDLRRIFEQTLGIAHHTELMNAALARDIPKAQSLMREHIGFSLAVYEALWPQTAGSRKG
ncbi:GntR family transcriptional regulator [Roseibium suaedae]|uniref:DNA-binding transcriptional regulator, GntR family n=1 Tax=Roseibium suaedae TaxID=735517 RepID=A0A1M7A9R8_9HYPH|nr:GntR family transcriptional regulator [Roseibium suaedae]SHL39463.1 DNA-binding transcriptional regulator, GntR family [Roseibium suaedae]